MSYAFHHRILHIKSGLTLLSFFANDKPLEFSKIGCGLR